MKASLQHSIMSAVAMYPLSFTTSFLDVTRSKVGLVVYGCLHRLFTSNKIIGEITPHNVILPYGLGNYDMHGLRRILSSHAPRRRAQMLHMHARDVEDLAAELRQQEDLFGKCGIIKADGYELPSNMDARTKGAVLDALSEARYWQRLDAVVFTSHPYNLHKHMGLSEDKVMMYESNSMEKLKYKVLNDMYIRTNTKRYLKECDERTMDSFERNILHSRGSQT